MLISLVFCSLHCLGTGDSAYVNLSVDADVNVFPLIFTILVARLYQIRGSNVLVVKDVSTPQTP